MSREDDFMLIDHNYSQERRNRFLFRVIVVGFAFIVVFVSITLILSASGPTPTRPKFVTNCSIAYNFDFNLLTLRWPTTTCYNTTKNPNECVKYDNNKWLIHGLWPTYNNQSWPQFCCFDREFNVTNLDPILTDLKSDWPNLIPQKSIDSLWRHEWTKHGTCTKTKQIDYFNNTIQLYKKYAVYEWLQESNIIPSNDKTYDSNAFNDVFKTKLKHKVQLICISHESKSFLTEILICLNHNQTEDIIDCPQESTCKKSFYYPKLENN